QGGTGAAEKVNHQVAGLTAVRQSPRDKLNWLHRWMEPVRSRLVFLPQSGLRLVPVPWVLVARDVTVENRLVLELVPAETPGKGILGPNDLAANLEAGAFERILKLSLPRRGMADVK